MIGSIVVSWFALRLESQWNLNTFSIPVLCLSPVRRQKITRRSVHAQNSKEKVNWNVDEHHIYGAWLKSEEIVKFYNSQSILTVNQQSSKKWKTQPTGMSNL